MVSELNDLREEIEAPLDLSPDEDIPLHEANGKEESELREDAVYVCKYKGCEAEFSLAWRYQAHLLLHSGEVVHFDTIPSKPFLLTPTPAPTTTYKCGKCKRKMKTKQSLEKHMKQAHQKESSAVVQPANSSHMMDVVEASEREDIEGPLDLTCPAKKNCLTTDTTTISSTTNTSITISTTNTISTNITSSVTSTTSLPPAADTTAPAGDYEAKGRSKYICTFEGCKAEFNRPGKYQAHLSVHAGNMPYRCEVVGCGRSYTSSSHLKRHRDLHHMGPPVKPPATFKCDKCHREVKTKQNLEKHMKRAHQKKKFACTDCEASFNKDTQLLVHRMQHGDQAPFECSVCQMRFTSNRDLNRHKRGHTIHSCPKENCWLVFPSHNLLRTHISTSHHEYECAYCGMHLQRRRFLVRHVHKHLLVEAGCIPSRLQTRPALFTCSLCSQVLVSKAGIQRHIKTKHPEKKVIKRRKSEEKAKNSGKKRAPRKDKGTLKKSAATRFSCLRVPQKVEYSLLGQKSRLIAEDYVKGRLIEVTSGSDVCTNLPGEAVQCCTLTEPEQPGSPSMVEAPTDVLKEKPLVVVIPGDLSSPSSPVEDVIMFDVHQDIDPSSCLGDSLDNVEVETSETNRCASQTVPLGSPSTSFNEATPMESEGNDKSVVNDESYDLSRSVGKESRKLRSEASPSSCSLPLDLEDNCQSCPPQPALLNSSVATKKSTELGSKATPSDSSLLIELNSNDLEQKRTSQEKPIQNSPGTEKPEALSAKSILDHWKAIVSAN